MMFFFYIMIILGAGLTAYALMHKTAIYLLKSIVGKSERSSFIYAHVNKYVSAYFDDKEEGWNRKRTNHLMYESAAILFLCLFFVLKINKVSPILIICSVLSALIPYLWLRIRLAAKQITGSYEGRIVIAELLNHYKMQNKNIVAAIDSSLSTLDEAPIGKHLLFRMSRKLKLCKSDDELQEILLQFSFTVGTQWANLLAQNIYAAVSEDIDITGGLEDLLKECDYVKKILEQRRQVSNEAFTIIKVLCPVTYVLLMLTLVKYFDFTVSDIIYYQIQTPNGMTFFFCLIFIAFVNMAAITIVSKPKFDF